jgi:hypothetical protein
VRRGALEVAFLCGLLALVASGQGLPSQPALDLPEHPSNYMPGALAAPVPDPASDPRDEPAPVFYGEEIDAPADALCYVIDFSGSMWAEDRIEKAKAEFARSVNGLPPSLRFGVVLYSCTIRARPMEKATPEAKASAIEFVNAWHPNSGTATGPAVVRALKLDEECRTVVVLTDGEPNCGGDGLAGHRAMIRSANAQGATINVFGIAAYGPWRGFCLDVARDSGGSYCDVP